MVYRTQSMNMLKEILKKLIREVLKMWKSRRTTPTAVYGWATSSEFNDHKNIPEILILPIDKNEGRTLRDGAQKLVDQLNVQALAFVDLQPDEVIVGVESPIFCETKKFTIEPHGDVKVLKEPEPYVTPIYLGILYKADKVLN